MLEAIEKKVVDFEMDGGANNFLVKYDYLTVYEVFEIAGHKSINELVSTNQTKEKFFWLGNGSLAITLLVVLAAALRRVSEADICGSLLQFCRQ